VAAPRLAGAPRRRHLDIWDHGQRQSPGDVLVYVIDAQDNVTHRSGHNPDEINPDLRGNLTGGKKRRKSRKQHKLKKTKEIQKAS